MNQALGASFRMSFVLLGVLLLGGVAHAQGWEGHGRGHRGAAEGPCYPNNTCDQGLYCDRGLCAFAPEETVSEADLIRLDELRDHWEGTRAWSGCAWATAGCFSLLSLGVTTASSILVLAAPGPGIVLCGLGALILVPALGAACVGWFVDAELNRTHEEIVELEDRIGARDRGMSY